MDLNIRRVVENFFRRGIRRALLEFTACPTTLHAVPLCLLLVAAEAEAGLLLLFAGLNRRRLPRRTRRRSDGEG